jgi:3-oxoacyl-[acyl-carrier protein] reductase
MKKTVLVTGSSRGIGKAIAVKFAKEGYNVIINCVKNEEKLYETKKEIERYQVPCLAYVCDVGNYVDASRLFHDAKSMFGSIDILINNAGISYLGLLSEMSIEDWNHIINTNLSSVFHCSKLALPDMIHKKEGKIINISSVWGSVGASCEVAYSATKGGIDSFTKALAKEVAPSNIGVNAIALGAIDTEMNGFLDEDEKQSLIDEIPIGRYGKCEEVADFVYQVATSSPYLNGQVIKFDGAWI